MPFSLDLINYYYRLTVSINYSLHKQITFEETEDVFTILKITYI